MVRQAITEAAHAGDVGVPGGDAERLPQVLRRDSAALIGARAGRRRPTSPQRSRRSPSGPTSSGRTFQECTGCAIKLLQTRTPQVANLILQQISLDYQDNVMAAAGDAGGEAASTSTVAGGDFYWVVEGAIPTKIPGGHDDRRQDRRARSPRRPIPRPRRRSPSAAARATATSRPRSPNPTGAMGVGDYLKDAAASRTRSVINISRCPGHAEDLVAALTYVLVTASCPSSTPSAGRCSSTARRSTTAACAAAHFEAGEFVESVRRRALRATGWCLYKIGCKGPVTYAPCGVTRWNGHVSWCVTTRRARAAPSPTSGTSSRRSTSRRPTSTCPASAASPTQTCAGVLGGGDRRRPRRAPRRRRWRRHGCGGDAPR